MSHQDILRAGLDAWKTWRSAHPTLRPILIGADLSHILLLDADLCDADLRHAKIRIARGADFRDADLSGAHLVDADLTGADLSHANLDGAVLHGADLTGARLTRARLTGADLRHVRGLRLDACYTERASLSPRNDPWSVLRSHYSPLSLLLPLGLILLYTVPYVAGARTGWRYWYLGAALLVYLLARLALTWRVGQLHQQEQTTHQTPAYRHYAGLYRRHRVLQLLMLAALAALILT